MAEEDVVAGIWHNLLNKLNADQRFTSQFRGFLSLVVPKGVLGETIYLEVSNDGTRNMIDLRMRPLLLEHLAANEEWGGPTNFAIVVNPAAIVAAAQEQEQQAEWTVAPAQAQAGFGLSSASATGTHGFVQANAASNSYGAQLETGVIDLSNGNYLNPNYTFDTYVIGDSNRMAHAAALAVGEAPGKAYKPLFIYGNSGLGKTHLLHAIGNYAISLYPRIRVRYVNSEEFTNDYINALRDQSTAEFQNQYRAVDVLLIDDIQFLAGKEGTQEAFFHLFNILHNNDKQVVITSDLPPKELDGFEDRLVSRFGGGLSADITAPTLETRIAILRKKIERDQTRISDEILEYIAQRVTKNIRELEGSLTRLTAWASLTKQNIDMNMVQTVLKDLVAVADDQVTTPVEVMNAVASYFNISVDELTGKSRQQAIARARQIAMYVCREKTGLSLPKIGQVFGGKDHTTVMYANKQVEKLMAERRTVYNQVTEILNAINKASF